MDKIKQMVKESVMSVKFQKIVIETLLQNGAIQKLGSDKCEWWVYGDTVFVTSKSMSESVMCHMFENSVELEGFTVPFKYSDIIPNFACIHMVGRMISLIRDKDVNFVIDFNVHETMADFQSTLFRVLMNINDIEVINAE